VLLARLGAVSQMAGIRYWSVTGKRWQILIEAAHALDPSGRVRPDFTPADLVPGRDLAFSQTDNDAGAVIYRMRIMALSPSRVVLRTENVDTIRYLMLPLFGPGELQSLYVLNQGSEGTWSYYSLTRTGPGASAMTDGHVASGINRAVAMYRHIAGIPTDQEPPAAP
jgi:hypothetical protein